MTDWPAKGCEPSSDRLARWRDLAAMVVLGLLPWIFFWRLFAAKPADRAVLAWGDLAAQYFPLRLFVARELAQGRWPLWNPYINAGQPALADAQSAVFYPPNLALALLAPRGELTLAMLQLYVVAHFALAAVLMYMFARLLLRGFSPGTSRLAAMAAAIAFTFGGYLTSFPVQQLTILEAGIWLPLMLLLLHLAVERGSLLLFALASLPVAMSWLAGHAQTTMYGLYLAAAYVVALSLWRTGRRTALCRVALSFASIAAGTALAAVQLLPSHEFLARSTRLDLSYAETSFGLPLSELFGLLLPGAFGGRTLYVGVSGLALAALALLLASRREVLFWLGTAIAALLVALGGNSFLYSALYLLAPGFSAVRDQERAVFLVSFALAILVGFGLAQLLSPARGIAQRAGGLRRALASTALALVAFALVASYWHPGNAQPPAPNPSIFLFAAVVLAGVCGLLVLRARGASARALAVLALGLLVFDLFTVNWQANLAGVDDAPRYASTKLTAGLSDLLAADASARLSSEGLLPGGGSAAVVYALPDIVGNTPFQLQRYARLNKVDELQRSRLLAVRYWLTKRDLKDGRLRPLQNEGDLHLYELAPEQRLARAFLVHEALSTAGDDEALRLVSTADLRKVAVLDAAAISAVTLAAPAAAEPAPQMVEIQPAWRTILVEPAAAALLVLSDGDYPGWQAFVDGVAAPVLRANYLLQAVAVPSGRHVVELRFEPQSLRSGALVSALAAALILSAAAFGLFVGASAAPSSRAAGEG